MLRILAVLAASGAALMIFHVSGAPRVATAQAQEVPSVNDIVQALKNRKTRGAAQATPATSHEIEDLKRIRKTRGWNLHDRARLAKATEGLGQIDLVIYFAFNSAEIQKESEPVLHTLGQALKSGDYKARVFVLAGHTDAKGNPEYNQSLSERRAEAVKRYIVTNFKLSQEELLTVGYGFEQLKDPQKPLSPVNRRVQVVNLAQ